MKKSIFNIFLGAFIGIVLMIGVVIVLNMKPDNEDIMAQNPNSTMQDSMSEEDFTYDSEFIVMEESTELETEFATEEIMDSEENTQNTVTVNPQPVNAPYYIRVNRLANCVTVYKNRKPMPISIY